MEVPTNCSGLGRIAASAAARDSPAEPNADFRPMSAHLPRPRKKRRIILREAIRRAIEGDDEPVGFYKGLPS